MGKCFVELGYWCITNFGVWIFLSTQLTPSVLACHLSRRPVVFHIVRRVNVEIQLVGVVYFREYLSPLQLPLHRNISPAAFLRMSLMDQIIKALGLRGKRKFNKINSATSY